MPSLSCHTQTLHPASGAVVLRCCPGVIDRGAAHPCAPVVTELVVWYIAAFIVLLCTASELVVLGGAAHPCAPVVAELIIWQLMLVFLCCRPSNTAVKLARFRKPVHEPAPVIARHCSQAGGNQKMIR